MSSLLAFASQEDMHGSKKAGFSVLSLDTKGLSLTFQPLVGKGI